MDRADEQGALLELPARAPAVVHGGAAADPVARVVVDVPLAHLDRPFDYLVPESMAAAAVPGARVQVRFAGKDRAAYIVERRADTDHGAALAPVRRAVSPVPVLTPAVLRLSRAVADRYAGTLADVLRLAVPPRHASTEKAVLANPAPAVVPPAPPAGAGWEPYTGGPAFLRHLGGGQAPRAVWTALPAGGEPTWARALAEAARAARAAGRGVLLVLPTGRQVNTVAAALAAELPGEPVVRLVAEDGPARRYRSFLRVLRGEVKVVVGTRAAAFAPVADLGLVACFDDGDDRLAEPRAPYPHARQVLLLRAEQEGAGLLLGGFTRTVEAQLLLERGWAHPVQAPRAVVRAVAPRVEAPTEVDLAREGPAGAARIPTGAWRLVKAALAEGPVLVQVARGGYVPVVACARCREPARCTACHGPLRVGGPRAAPSCGWCGRPATAWTCPVCRHPGLRAQRVGSGRTAEELGRAFPTVPVVVSGTTAAHGVVATVDERPRLVVATPGAEPVAGGGYAAALLLDAGVTTARPELWAGAEALRRWLGAAALVRGHPEGGRVMLLGGPAPVPAQALVRWDPAGFAARELAERAELSFPPAVRLASVSGPAAAVRSFLVHLDTPPEAEVLGPVEIDDGVRALVRAPRASGAALSRELSRALAARTARKEDGAVRVQVDPPDLW